MLKKVIFVLAALVLAFSLCACGILQGAGPDEDEEKSVKPSETSSEVSETESTSPVPEGEISVCVFGDSIARGYGLADPEAQRFSTLLGEKLKSRYLEVDVSNFGVDGRTGSELAEFLENDPPAQLASADVVIISIGGNNVLRGLGDLLGQELDLDAAQLRAFGDYFKNMFATGEDAKALLDSAAAELDKLFRQVNGMFESESFKDLINTASVNLESDLPRIISAVKAAAPEAKIYLQTIYNPYQNIGIELSQVETKLDLSAFGRGAVTKLNEVIEAKAASLGYKLAPVYARFSESDDKLTNAGIDINGTTDSEPISFNVDPHPNADGHKYIADIYYDLLTGGN